MSQYSEAWLLEQLEAERLDTPALLVALDSLKDDDGRRLECETWAQMICDSCIERGDFETATLALGRKAALRNDTAETNKEYAKIAAKMLAHDRNLAKLVDDAGFGKQLPPVECLRRLSLLLSLKSGAICYDSTWGQGVVRDLDMFYHRVTIDFESKKKHQLALEYAAETLEILASDHYLARCIREREEMRALAENDPAETVKIVIASMGAMNVDELKSQIIPRLLGESDWKRFWDGARKELKKDPLFELPGKRQEPLRILAEQDELYGAAWFEKLREVRDIGTLVDQLESCIRNADAVPQAQPLLAVVSDRIDFIVKGARRSQPDMAARALLIAEQFLLERDSIGRDADYTLFHDIGTLKKTTDQLPARHLRAFLTNLILHSSDRVSDIIIPNIDQFSHTVLSELTGVLMDAGYGDALAEVFLKAIQTRSISARMMLWVLRNEEIANAWSLPAAADMTTLALRILETENTGDDQLDYRRLRNQLEDSAWLKKTLDQMTPARRKDFTQRVMQSPAWPSLDRKSMLAKIIRIDPSMEDVVAPPADRGAARPVNTMRTTSIRMYNELVRQLERIINTDIPENSREIAEARAHGDLRENAEFKAAKERQGLLMKRRSELEQQIQSVEATDFADSNTAVCGSGTIATLAYEDGTTTTYAILGEWDSDQNLNIISSNSLLAIRLKGKKTGDSVSIPSNEGDITVVVESIAPLTDEIRAWING